MAIDLNGKELPKGISQRKDGRYMAQITYYGKRYVLYDRSLKEIRKKTTDLRYELDHGIYAEEKNITIDSWFNTWLKVYKETTVKKGTVCVYRDNYNGHLRDIIGKKKLKELRAEHIQKIYNDLHKAEYSRNTIELVSTVLNGMFKQAVRNKIIKENPVPLATLPREEEEEERRVMTLEEQKIFLKYSEGSYLFDLFKTGLSTGMRSGELRGLEWKHVDFKKKIIHITKTLVYYNNEYLLESPKTKSSKRDIPMLDSICVLLKQHKKRQNENRLLLGDKWKPKEGLEDLVFTSETGYPINRDVLKQEMNQIVACINNDGIEFEHITPHCMRHTFATRCIENGMSYKTLQMILGHSKLSMTMDLYAHVLPDTKESEIQCIAGI